MKLRFWGVRGSAAVPGPTTAEFGGNTSCMELEDSGAGFVLFDGGTGIRAAGMDLLRRTAGKPPRVHVFLTHFHWDHIQGIPFFAPIYIPGSHITFYSSGFTAPLRKALEGLMAAPYFPVEFGTLAAKIEIAEMGSSPIQLDGLCVRPIEVNHPQGACAYRMETQGASAVYSPDREHGDARLDGVFADAVRGATALVMDSQYTPEEYTSHLGWGHSTWAEAVRVARAGEVEKLVLFHHDPGHTDEVLRNIEENARAEFPETHAAREGWSLTLGGR